MQYTPYYSSSSYSSAPAPAPVISYTNYGPQVPYAPNNFAGSVTLITRSSKFPYLTFSSTIISCGSQPIFWQPTTSYVQPTTSYAQPAVSYAQPVNYTQPAVSYTPTTTSYVQPTTSYTQPTVTYSKQPSFGGIMPSPFCKGWKNIVPHGVGEITWSGSDRQHSGVVIPRKQPSFSNQQPLQQPPLQQPLQLQQPLLLLPPPSSPSSPPPASPPPLSSLPPPESPPLSSLPPPESPPLSSLPPPESPPLIDSDVHWKDLLKSLRNQEGYCDFPLPDIISNYESLLDMLSDEKSKAIVFDISKYNSIATKINDSMISKSRSFDAFFLLHRELKSVDNYVNMKKDSRQPSFAPEKAMESSIFPAKINSC